jgi:hypothetical protein
VSAIREKDVPIPRSGTSIWAEGCKQAAGRRYPSRARGHPSGLMASGKQPQGSTGRLDVCIHAASWMPASGQKESPFRASRTLTGPHGREETTRRMHRSEKGLGPSGRLDSRKGREGCTASRVAPGHAPSSTRGSGGRIQRSTKKASPLVLIDAIIEGRAALDRPDGRLASRDERRRLP